jgi:hypothetical protein
MMTTLQLQMRYQDIEHKDTIDGRFSVLRSPESHSALLYLCVFVRHHDAAGKKTFNNLREAPFDEPTVAIDRTL